MQNPVLFVPGTFCTELLFSPQTAFLAAHGYTTSVAKIDGGNNVTDIARAILKSAPPKFDLVGLSMGGIIAFEILRQAPNRVSKLALLDTNAKAELPENIVQRRMHINAIERLESEGSDGFLPFVEYSLFPKYTAAQGQKLSNLKHIVLQMAEQTTWKIGKQQLRALNTRPDSTSFLSRINVPTIIIMGEDDQLCPLDRHELLTSNIPNNQFHILPGCGHLSTLERPEAVNQLLLSWLAQKEETNECSNSTETSTCL